MTDQGQGGDQEKSRDQRPALDDPAARARVLAAILAGENLDAAAAQAGVSRRALTKACIRDPDFGDQVRRARGAAEPVVREGPTATAGTRSTPARSGPPAVRLGRASVSVERCTVESIEELAARSKGRIMTREEFIAWCCDTARDPDHRSGPTCTKVLAELYLGEEIQRRRLAAQREAERDLDTSKPEDSVVLVELPRNGSEAPGHEPKPVTRRPVLDVESREGLDS